MDTPDQPRIGIHAGMTVTETLRVFDSKLDTAAENMTDVRDQLDEVTNDITALREQLAGAVQQLQPKKSSGLIITGG